MTKQETCTYLRNHGIAFEVTEHSAVYNMAECAALALLYPEDDAKNLFARDDKKRQYFLIPVRGDRRVDLKQFRCAHGTSPGLRLRRRAASVCLTPGSVTPLGLLQDPAHQVQSFLDADFLTRWAGSASTPTTIRRRSGSRPKRCWACFGTSARRWWSPTSLLPRRSERKTAKAGRKRGLSRGFVLLSRFSQLQDAYGE